MGATLQAQADELQNHHASQIERLQEENRTLRQRNETYQRADDERIQQRETELATI